MRLRGSVGLGGGDREQLKERSRLPRGSGSPEKYKNTLEKYRWILNVLRNRDKEIAKDILQK